MTGVVPEYKKKRAEDFTFTLFFPPFPIATAITSSRGQVHPRSSPPLLTPPEVIQVSIVSTVSSLRSFSGANGGARIVPQTLAVLALSLP